VAVFLVSGVLILFGLIFITPLVIDPLFNKFEPAQKQHPDLVASIDKLNAACGVPIPPERMFLMMASKKNESDHAYVTGLGASKRVVIWDRRIQKMSRDESFVSSLVMNWALRPRHVRRVSVRCHWSLGSRCFSCFGGLHWALDRWQRTGELWARGLGPRFCGPVCCCKYCSSFFAGHQRVQPYQEHCRGMFTDWK